MSEYLNAQDLHQLTGYARPVLQIPLLRPRIHQGLEV